MNSPLFSVIIPVYNVAGYIENTISSILKQTYTDYELILVDDGSTDGSEKICDTFKLQYPEYIQVIHKNNRGVSSARNIGIEKARGEYILFVDGDDVIKSNTLELLKKIIDECAPDLIDYNLKFVDLNYKNISESILLNRKNISSNNLILEKINNPLIPCTASCYKNNIINKNNIRFNENLYYVEDALFWINCVINSNNIVSIDNSFYLYTHRLDSAVNSKYVPYFKIKTELIGWNDIKNLTNDNTMVTLIDKRIQEIKYRHMYTYIELYLGHYSELSNIEIIEIKKFIKDNVSLSLKYKEMSRFTRGFKGVLTAYVFNFSPRLYVILKKFF